MAVDPGYKDLEPGVRNSHGFKPRVRGFGAWACDLDSFRARVRGFRVQDT